MALKIGDFAIAVEDAARTSALMQVKSVAALNDLGIPARAADGTALVAVEAPSLGDFGIPAQAADGTALVKPKVGAPQLFLEGFGAGTTWGRVYGTLCYRVGASLYPVGTKGGILAGNVNAAQVYGGLLYFVGEFWSLTDGTSIPYACRLNSSDELEAFGGTGFNSYLYNMVEWDGKLVFVGTFTTVDGSTAKGVAAWDGSSWTTFAGGVRWGADGTAAVYSAAVFDGKLYITGSFNQSETGTTLRGIAYWDPDTSAWVEPAGGLQATVANNQYGQGLCVWNGKLYVATAADNIGGLGYKYVARLTTALAWERVGASDFNGIPAQDSLLAVDDDYLYMGSTAWSTYGATAFRKVARFDLTSGEWSDSFCWADAHDDYPRGRIYKIGTDIIAQRGQSSWGPDEVFCTGVLGGFVYWSGTEWRCEYDFNYLRPLIDHGGRTYLGTLLANIGTGANPHWKFVNRAAMYDIQQKKFVTHSKHQGLPYRTYDPADTGMALDSAWYGKIGSEIIAIWLKNSGTAPVGWSQFYKYDEATDDWIEWPEAGRGHILHGYEQPRPSFWAPVIQDVDGRYIFCCTTISFFPGYIDGVKFHGAFYYDPETDSFGDVFPDAGDAVCGCPTMCRVGDMLFAAAVYDSAHPDLRNCYCPTGRAGDPWSKLGSNQLRLYSGNPQYDAPIYGVIEDPFVEGGLLVWTLGVAYFDTTAVGPLFRMDEGPNGAFALLEAGVNRPLGNTSATDGNGQCKCMVQDADSNIIIAEHFGYIRTGTIQVQSIAVWDGAALSRICPLQSPWFTSAVSATYSGFLGLLNIGGVLYGYNEGRGYWQGYTAGTLMGGLIRFDPDLAKWVDAIGGADVEKNACAYGTGIPTGASYILYNWQFYE